MGLFGVRKKAAKRGANDFKKGSENSAILAGMTTTTESGLHKAYIPDFLYKPPFGYPRKDNVSLLRELAKNPYIYSVVKTLCDEAASTDYDIVPKENVIMTPALDKKRMELLNFFDNPNSNKETFKQIVRMVVKDICELDSGVIVKAFNEFQELVEIYARDGGSFLLNPDIYGYLGNRTDYIKPMELMYLQPTSPDIQASMNSYSLAYKETAAYFQYGAVAMALPVPFGKKEVIYMKQNPQSNNIYGLSPLQILADIITTLVYGSAYNLDFYMNNNMPEGIISAIGMKTEHLRAFQERLQSQVRVKDEKTGFWRKIGFKVPASNVEVKFTPLQLDPKVMQIIEQQDWFSRLLWACFGITADEMGFCYSEDTRVLTDTGFKYYWEVKETDKIATIIEEDNSIEYIEPESINIFNVENRKFHHYKNACVDVLVSDDHRMYYRTQKNSNYKMARSKDIPVNTVKFLQGGLKWIGKDIKHIEIPKYEYNNNKDKSREQQIKFSIDDFCEFMGYYLSEGSVLNKMNENHQYSIKISQTKERGVKTMGPIMDKLGFRKEQDCWKINNKSLAIYLYQFGKSGDKYIPSQLKNLPVNRLKILLNALLEGDGRVEDTGHIRYSTNSIQLAYDVYELMLKTGYKASINVREFENKNWNTNYIISGNMTQTEPRVIINKQRKEVLYSGVMWCPSVYNRPFITERNGKTGIHYNTESSNKAVSQTQSAVYKRKAVRPILGLLKSYFDKELITEFGDDLNHYLEFRWDDYDMEEDVKKHTLLEQEIRMGVKTPEMVADELGIDIVKLEESQSKQAEKNQELMGNEEESDSNNDDDKKETKPNPLDIKSDISESELEEELVKSLKAKTKEIMTAIKRLDKSELDKIQL